MRFSKVQVIILAAGLLTSSCSGSGRPEPDVSSQEGDPAAYHEVEILDPKGTVLGVPVDIKAFCCEHKHGTSPAVVDARKAFRATSEYAKIRREGLDERDAHWHVLRHRAQERVLAAVRLVARRRRFDLVLLPEAVRIKPEITGKHIPDITKDVVEVIKR